MGKTLGYMVTFSTYGSWLQGDKRRYVKDGKILEPNEKLEQINMDAMKTEEVKLRRDERETARMSMLQEAERIGEKVLALSVGSNHVHAVINEGGKSVEWVVNRLKTAAYYSLREHGLKGKVWTRGYDKRFCFDEMSLKNRIEYVERQRRRHI